MNTSRLLSYLFRLTFIASVAAGVEARAQISPPSRTSTGELIIRSDPRLTETSHSRSPNDDPRFRVSNDVAFLLGKAKSAANARKPRYAEAESAYRRVIAFDATEVRAYEGLGSVYLAQKLYDEAIDSYEQAVARSPRRPEAHYGLGVAHYEAGHREGAAAQGAILRALKGDKPKKLADKLDALIAQ